MKKEDFIKLIHSQERKASSTVHLPSSETNELSCSLGELLQLQNSRLSAEAQIVLEILENDKEFGCRREFQEFKWMVLAYINFQDAFPSVIYDDFDERIIFARNYFYYEALSILKEYIYCGVNNMITSANHLVRTFIEFNLRQLYFSERCKRDGSFISIREYLKRGVAPSNQTIINYLVPSTSFFKPIKKSIQVVLKGLSESSSHAFSPIHSARSNANLNHESSIDCLLFWLRMYSSFGTVLWLYCTVFPTLLRPREILRKFGFNYIPGLFISNEQFIPIKKSFKDDDLSLFIEQPEINGELLSLDNTYNSFPDLTDEEIRETWTEEGKLQNFKVGYAQLLAKMRVTNEILANKFSVEGQDILFKNIKTDLGQAIKYSFWRDNYKSM